jgi:regulator of sirC expression with transglutaminase-like and TPR domain
VSTVCAPGTGTVQHACGRGRAGAGDAAILGVVSPPLGESPARRRFASLIARPSVPLAETALAIAEEEYPGLDSGFYLARLDALGREVEGRLGPRRNAAATLRLLKAVLFEEEKFRGNVDEYYDPRNSFLNEVLERRLGVPITLSIIFIEVASRVGLPVQGVGFPGHFLVKYVAGAREVFVDPYHGGDILSAEECAARFQARTQGRSLDPRHLEAVSVRQILGRMLHNLKKNYVEAADDVRALWVTDRLVLLAPEDPAERRDRGLIEARLGGTTAALADLGAYLSAAPSAEDVEEVRELCRQLRGRASFLN